MNYETNLSADSSVYLLLTLACPVQVLAAGEGNMDGGGSGMGQGTAQNFWSPGNDGVRITVVNAETGEAAAPSVDFPISRSRSLSSISRNTVSWTTGPELPLPRHREIILIIYRPLPSLIL